tara:strand:- start:18400 stop:20538 length:2139 start_codon:yes stop_codon:yes gene_type:complete
VGTKKYASLSYNRLFKETKSELLDTVGYTVASGRDFNEELIGYLNNFQAITAGDLERYYISGESTPWAIPQEISAVVRNTTDEEKLKNALVDIYGYDYTSIQNATGTRLNDAGYYEGISGAMGTDYGYNPVTGLLNSSKFFALPYLLLPFYDGIPSNWEVRLMDIGADYEVEEDLDSGGPTDYSAIAPLTIEYTKKSNGQKYTAGYRFRSNITLTRREYVDRETEYRINPVAVKLAVFEYENQWYSSYYLGTDSRIPVSPPVQTTGNSWAEYYPWIPISVDSSYTNSSVFSDKERQEVKDLMKTVKLDLDIIVSSLKAARDSELIDDAYIYPSIDLMSKQEESLNYVFDYFKDYYPSHATDEPLSNNIALRPRLKGKLGYAAYNTHFMFTDMIYTAYVERSGGNNRGEFHIEIPNDKDVYILYRRLNGNIYERVQVRGLYYYVNIRHGRGDLADINSMKRALSKGSSNGFVRLPLIRNRMHNYTSKEQGLIAIDAFGLEVGAYEEVDTKWYESGLFKFVLTIVAVVITVFTWDFSGTWISLALSIAQSLAVAYVAKILVEKVGGELGFALAIIVSVYFGGNFKDLATFIKAGLVNAALVITNAFLSVFEMVLANEQELLEEEIEDYEAMLRGKEKELQAAYELLPDPYESDGVYAGLEEKDVIIIESPTEFYFRTTHAGNVGAAVLDYPSYYVEGSLDLTLDSAPELEYVVI